MSIRSKAVSTIAGVIVGLASIFVAAITLGSSILVCLVNGFVGMHLWNWFITPIGVKSITYVQAAGLALLFSFWSPVTFPSQPKPSITKTGTEVFAEFISLFLFRPAIALLFGYIFHHLMS